MVEPVKQLVLLMRDDLERHRSLATVWDNMLDAMKHYDISRLEALKIHEQQLVESIADNAKKRNEVVLEATRKYFPNRKGQTATARELAQKVREPMRNRLLTVMSLLKEVAGKVQQLNSVNELAAQKLLGHVDCIFRLIAQSGKDIGLYGRAGKKRLLEQNRLVDAVV